MIWRIVVILCLGLIGLCIAGVDPECHMTTPQIIKYHGYPAEIHYVVTKDGYILQLHRLPHGRRGSTTNNNGNRPVAFLQHGVMDSSSTWVVNFPNQSLAFILADHGFDVWLGNIRGNTYSTNHTTLSTKDPKFWDFSFDEMAEIDLPAMIQYVLKKTEVDNVMYVGHSQGSVMAFIEMSRNHKLAKHINMNVALAPIARITHVRGFFKHLSEIVPTVDTFFEIFGINEFAPPNIITKELAVLFCPLVGNTMCEEFAFFLAGFDYSNMNSTRVPVYGSHFPAGTSVKDMMHWFQVYSAKILQAYDFRSDKENMAHYNSTTPPPYDITQLTVPTMLVAGGNDYLGDPRDVAWLEGQLRPDVVIDNIFLDAYNHLDFIWGLDAPVKVYQHILKNARKLGII